MEVVKITLVNTSDGPIGMMLCLVILTMTIRMEEFMQRDILHNRNRHINHFSIVEIVKLLVTLGCDVNDCPAKHGVTPLHLGVRCPELVEYLLQQGSNVEALCRIPADNMLIKANNFLTPLGLLNSISYCTKRYY